MPSRRHTWPLVALALLALVALAGCDGPEISPTPTGGPASTTPADPLNTAPAGTPVAGTPVAGTATQAYPNPGQTLAPSGTSYPPPGQTAVRGPGVLYLPVVVAGAEIRESGTPTPTPTITLTPTPSLTPTPRWPPALAEPGLSKLGLHIIFNDDQDIFEFMRVTKPRVVKVVDDFGGLAEVKQFSPSTVTIGRIGLAFQPMEGDPAERARAFVAEHLDTYLNYPAVDYWEGYNEPSADPASMAWYAAFEAERARVMASHGRRVAIGAFSTGTPEYDAMVLFLPAIRAAQQHGGVLALHEYSAPTMQHGVGAGIPGQPALPDRGSLTLRYRYFYEGLLKPRGLAIPLVISEAGIDGGIRGRPGPADAIGWRQFSTYWSEIGLGGDSTATYIDQLAWYDQELRRDDYVIGATVFTVGGRQMSEWQSFDITDILTRLARYVVSQVP